MKNNLFPYLSQEHNLLQVLHLTLPIKVPKRKSNQKEVSLKIQETWAEADKRKERKKLTMIRKEEVEPLDHNCE